MFQKKSYQQIFIFVHNNFPLDFCIKKSHHYRSKHKIKRKKFSRKKYIIKIVKNHTYQHQIMLVFTKWPLNRQNLSRHSLSRKQKCFRKFFSKSYFDRLSFKNLKFYTTNGLNHFENNNQFLSFKLIQIKLHKPIKYKLNHLGRKVFQRKKSTKIIY